MSANVFDSFSRAFKHTEKILFKPFDLGKWMKLGFASLFISSGSFSGGNFNYNNTNDNGEKQKTLVSANNEWLIFKQKLFQALGIHDWTALSVLLAPLIVLVAVLMFIFMWLSAVFNFVFIENIVNNRALIREPFHRLRPEGRSLFFWNLGLMLISLLLFAIFAVIGFYCFTSFYNSHQAHYIIWIVLDIIAFFFAAVILAVISVLTSDFVVPVMYAENVKILNAWGKFKPLTGKNTGSIIVYLLMKIVIGIAQAIIGIFAALGSMIVVGIPVLIIALLIAVITGALHLTWNAATISIAAFLAMAAVAIFIYIFNVFMVPVEVFRKTFAIDLLGQFNGKWDLLKTRQESRVQSPES